MTTFKLDLIKAVDVAAELWADEWSDFTCSCFDQAMNELEIDYGTDTRRKMLAWWQATALEYAKDLRPDRVDATLRVLIECSGCWMHRLLDIDAGAPCSDITYEQLTEINYARRKWLHYATKKAYAYEEV